MKKRLILRVKYFSANKPLRILRRGKRKTIDFYKSLKYVLITLIAFFKGEPIRNHPKFHFSLMRLRSVIILALIGLMLASFLSFAGGGIFAGVSNSWVVAPDTQLSTATVSNLQSTGYGAVELERYFNKTMDDVRIPYDRSTRRQEFPRSVATADGSMYVVWQESNSNEVGIQKFNSSGVRQWQYDKLAFGASCIRPAGTFSSVTAIAAYGNDVIVVSGCRNAGTGFNEIYAQRLNSSGVRQWVLEVRVNDDTTRNKINPEVEVIGSDIFVFWTDERDAVSDYDVYAQKLSVADGSRQIVGDQLIAESPGGTAYKGPYSGKTSNNKLIVEYSDATTVYARQYDTSFTLEWGPISVGTGAVDSKGFISLTVIGENSYYFWRKFSAAPPNWQIYGQSLTNAGAKRWNAGADLRVGRRVVPSNIQSWNDGTNPYFGAGEFSGANDRPYGKKVDAANGNVLWGGIFDNEPPIATGTNVAPHQINFWVIYNNGYNYVFYDRLTAGSAYFEDIYYNRFDTDDNINYPADLLVNQDFEYADQDAVNLVKDGGGNIFATWRDSVAGINDHIHANLFNSSGVRQWANDTTVNSSGVNPNYGPPKAVNVGTDYYVVWEVNGRIYMNKINSAGVRQWADVEVPKAGHSENFNPSIAYDGTNLAVVWDDNRALTGNYEIYFNSVSTAGVVQLANDQRVNVETIGSQTVPVIRSDGVNTYVIWQDRRSGDNEIYMQRVNGSGVPQYVSDLKVDDSGAGNDSYDPDFIMDGGSQYIVFRDDRLSNPNTDIYLTKFTGNIKQFNDVRVNSASANTKTNPHLGISGGGLYIIWEDERNSVTYHDIYITKFDTNGVKKYLGDTKVSPTIANVHFANPAITPNDRFFGWNDDREGATDYNTYMSYGSDINEPSGTMLGTGMILDTGTVNVRYQTISWTDTVPANTTVRFRSRTATTLGGLAAAAWSAYYTVSGENITSSDLQFMEIELLLDTTDTTTTPTVTNFTVAYLTNEAPVVNNITIQSTDNRQVQFSYDLNDVDDPTAVITFEYLYGGTWHASTHVTNLGLKAVGSSYNSVWDSTFDIPPTEVVTIQIRLTADDQYSFNNIGTGLSPPFLLDYQPPSVSSSVSPSFSKRPPSPTFSESISPSPSFSHSPSPSFTGNPPPPRPPWDDIINFFTSLAHNRLIPFSAWLIALIIIITFWRYNPYVWLGRRRKKRKWGLVFDEGTKKPVPSAIVEVYTAEMKELKQRIICNENGEFDLLLPAGKFYLNVRSPQVVQIKEGPYGTKGGSYTTGREDLYYKNLYFDKEIIDTSSLEKRTSQEVQLSIPMITKDILKSKKKMHQAWEKILDVLEYLRLPLLIIGTFLALILLIARGNIADIIIFIVYLLIWAWDIYVMLSTETAVVYVYDDSSFKPLDLVVLRLIKEKNQAIIAVETTNKDGKAVFKTIENGVYKIQAAKAGYKVYRTEPQSIKTLKALGRIKIGLKSNNN